MITDYDPKQIIRQALTEDYTKENNKTFGLSNNTIQQYNLTQQFLNFIQLKDKENLINFLHDKIVLNNELVESDVAVKKLISIEPDNISKIEQRSISIKLSMSIGGNISINDCQEESNMFFVPWDHLFLCRLSLKIKDKLNSLDLNYVIQFNDNNKITMIDFYSRDEYKTTDS